MRRALVLVVAAVGLLLSGAPALGAAPPPDVQAIVITGLLRRADFPAGWQTTKPGVPPNYSKLGTACRPLATALDQRVQRGISHGFILNNAEKADNTVVLFPSVTAAAALLAAVQNPTTTACYRHSAAVSLATTSKASGVRLRVMSVTPIAVAPAGDQSFGYEVVVQASAKGQTQLLYEDATSVRVGRAAVGFDFVNTGSSPNGAFTPQVQAVVARIRAAE